jgi:hypothetical protein
VVHISAAAQLAGTRRHDLVLFNIDLEGQSEVSARNRFTVLATITATYTYDGGGNIVGSAALFISGGELTKSRENVTRAWLLVRHACSG